MAQAKLFSPRMGRTELLNPAQDRPPADVDPPVGPNAGDAFSRCTQLQVVPDSEQDDVTWEVTKTPGVFSPETIELLEGFATHPTGIHGSD